MHNNIISFTAFLQLFSFQIIKTKLHIVCSYIVYFMIMSTATSAISTTTPISASHHTSNVSGKCYQITSVIVACTKVYNMQSYDKDMNWDILYVK